MITAQSRRSLEVESREELLETDIKQTIEFSPSCNIDSMSSILQSNRNYIIYDKNEEVARYALTSSIVSNSEKSPCKDFGCNRFSYCILDQDQKPKCECLKGYTPFGLNGCADIDECSTGRNECSNDAECINKNGHYICRCHQGYIGNGTFCEKRTTCEDLKCDLNAECMYNEEGNDPFHLHRSKVFFDYWIGEMRFSSQCSAL